LATNPYVNSQHVSGTGEQYLVEDLIVEVIKMWGVDVYVIPRDTNDTIDWIYGEDPLKKFSQSYMVEMYMNNTMEWEGQGDFFSKFGLEIRDDATFVVARRSFSRHVPARFSRSNGGPREGDLIWSPLTNAMWEIKKVEEEKNFFALGRKRPYFYELKCERFRYSNEKFSTGITTIDEDMMKHSYLVKFNLSLSGSNGTYVRGETVYSSNTKLDAANAVNAYATAVVADFNAANATLNVGHTKGIFTIGTKVWGVNSNASFVLTGFNDMVDERFNDIVDNRRLEVEANNVLTFDVNNPFGNP
jgi:hypothetical protein